LPRKYTIAVLPGDGIGPEVVQQAVRVAGKAAEIAGSRIVFDTYHGGARYWQRNRQQREWEPEVFEKCKSANAILMGPIGLPGANYADGRMVGGKIVFGLRMGLDLYANVRPAKLFPGVKSPLTNKTDNDIDLVVVRENTEDLYAGIQGSLSRNQTEEVAIDVGVTTAKGAERIIDYAFKIASKRSGRSSDKKKIVTCVDKSNVLSGSILFRSIFEKVSKKYPKIKDDYAFVDAMTQWMIRKPEEYDVIVTTNLFGDILSDLAAGIVGGLGLAPSGNIGTSRAIFGPVHGSAPTHAGKNVANPVAAILSAAMMFDWLAEKHTDHRIEICARLIRKATIETLRDPANHTTDLGGYSSTSKISQTIQKNIVPISKMATDLID
jgi:3-isopropylmalate dehydrogenase